MKRISYTSRIYDGMAIPDLEELGKKAFFNNQKLDITGALVHFAGLFFQIIEGSEENIDELFAKIRQDPRHKDILILKTETDVVQRHFPEWSMKIINLDRNADELIKPVKIMLQTIIDSHAIIEKYTQPAVLNLLSHGLNPLIVPPRKIDRIILFGDIVAFSTISEFLPVEKVAWMINHFLDIASSEISAKGGEVTKFIGDCIMAYFPGDCADNAIEACLGILRKLQAGRQSANHNEIARLLYCGFGLSKGIVIEGNLGSTVKTDYTILGDPVNTASRLEAMTRVVKKTIVVSEDVKNAARPDWNFCSLGRLDLKGKAKSCEAFSPDHELANSFVDKKRLAEKIAVFQNRQ